MAEEIGTISYEVRAETAQAIASSKQMDVALSQIEKSAKSTDAGMHKLNTTMTATATSVKAATSGMGGMRNIAGQLGYQLQDIAVQAQMGVSAFTILGQQGSQVASVFGPTGAMVGAIIAVGAALLGMASASDTAGESIDELAKKADSLGQAQIEDAINKANVELQKEQQTLIKLNSEIQRVDTAQRNAGLTTGVFAVKLTELRAEQEAQSDVVNQLIGNIDRLTASLSGSVDAAEKSRQATKEIVSDLQFETAALSLNEAQRAAAIAQRRAGVDAASAEGKAIEQAAVAYVNEKQSIEAADKARRESEANAKKAAAQAESEQKRLESQYQASENSLRRMAQQLTIAGLSTQGLARDAAQLAAAYSLGDTATEAQINRARELAGALFDLNEQKKRENELEGQKKQAEQFTKQVAFDAASPLEKIDIEEQAKLAKLQEYKSLLLAQEGLSQQEILAQEQQFQTARNQIIEAAAMERQQIETARNSMILGASADFFGGMADLAGTFAGEQSGAYKALFAISKGFAIANAALQLQTAIANASALPFPANLGAIGQAVTLGGQIASSIAGVSYGGGRQFGGPVNPGSMYRVGEGNAPELLSVGGSNYMIPGSRGQVTPMDGAGGGVTFNITNNASDMVQTQQSYDPETRTVELAITAVANQMNTRTGKIGAAMKSAGAYSRLG